MTTKAFCWIHRRTVCCNDINLFTHPWLAKKLRRMPSCIAGRMILRGNCKYVPRRSADKGRKRHSTLQAFDMESNEQYFTIKPGQKRSRSHHVPCEGYTSKQVIENDSFSSPRKVRRMQWLKSTRSTVSPRQRVVASAGESIIMLPTLFSLQ